MLECWKDRRIVDWNTVSAQFQKVCWCLIPIQYSMTPFLQYSSSQNTLAEPSVPELTLRTRLANLEQKALIT